MHIPFPFTHAGVVVSRRAMACVSDRADCDRAHAPGDFHERRSSSLTILHAAVHFRLQMESGRSALGVRAEEESPGLSIHRNRSMNLTRCYCGNSVASRILAAGLLPLPQLRCSCQGVLNLSQVRPGIAAVQCSTSKAKFLPQQSIFVTLGDEAPISQRATKKDSAGPGDRSEGRSAFLKILSDGFYVCTGAEGQQGACR